MPNKGLHIGIIPDGSRRWVRKNRLKNYKGEEAGETADKVTRHIFDNYPNIREVSLWARSTDNQKRNEADKNIIYGLLNKKVKEFTDYAINSGKEIKINIVGSRWGEMPQDVKDTTNDAIARTRNHTGPVLNLCIGYGGKQEIIDAAMGASKWLRKNPRLASLHKNVFERHLMVPRPLDIMIRTGGERRLSGFMLYQIEYAELFFVDKLWPDFTTKDFDDIIKDYEEREKRFGK